LTDGCWWEDVALMTVGEGAAAAVWD